MSQTTGPTGFAANEPTVVGYIATWILANAGAYLVGHTHLVTDQQWGAVASFLTPLITAAVLGVLATIHRRFVTPAWKAAQTALTGTPLAAASLVPLIEFDVEQLAASVAQRLAATATTTGPATKTGSPKPSTAGDTPVPAVADLPPLPGETSVSTHTGAPEPVEPGNLPPRPDAANTPVVAITG